ncbi:MAG: hypothetical protein II776_01940, partial [Clostridia bacterium]|nr:hypothetical protein [Clostridia bacterium]
EKTRTDLRTNIRMDYSEKDDYLASVAALKKKYAGKIRILSGFECEYCPGREEELFELKRESDLFLLGQHYVLRPGEEPCCFRKGQGREDDVLRYAEYVEKAMALGLPDIFAHPDVYLNNRPWDFTETDALVAHRICRAAAEYDVPVEINLHNIFIYTYRRDKTLNDDPFDEQITRLGDVSYPRRPFWEIAARYPLRVVYGMDVHRRHEIPRRAELMKLAGIIIGDEIMAKLNFVDRI